MRCHMPAVSATALAALLSHHREQGRSLRSPPMTGKPFWSMA